MAGKAIKFAEEAISLKANITRTIEHVERLEHLTTTAASAGYNTTAIEKLLEEAKQHLENATRELRAMNLEKAIEEFSIAQGLLDELKGYMNNLTNLVTESNTEQYLQEAKKRVSAAKANITQSVTLTPKAKEDAITALNNSEISLANARDQIEENNVDEAIEELEDAKKWEEESDRTISAVAATPNSVAPTTDRGSTTNESLTPTNENATRPKITATE